jgi:hypothetical protein
MANVFVTNVDQRSGAGHTIASFTVDPTSCIRDTAQAQQPCMYPVDDKAAYADNAMVTIGFATAWQCPQTNYPLGNHPDWDYGKQLTTRYALVWTDYCAGIALDGILFELRGGGAPNPTPPSGAPARLPNPLCDPKQPHPNMMHIVQFVDSYCDTQSATACGDSYQVAGPNGTVLTRYYNQWYLDNSGGDKPCLVPDTLADGVHVVNDEASANLPNGTPLTKIFRAFVMRGTEVTEVIDWSRQGLQNPVQDSRAGGLPRELKSNYTVALDSSAQIKKQLRDPLCAAIHSASATAQQDPILVGVAASPYLGCTN